MSDLSADLRRAKKDLLNEKFHQQWDYRELAECLEKYASMFGRTSPDQHRDIIAQFHDCAGRLPYVLDQDFGALVLEATAADTDDKDLRIWLLTEARYRARWCASAGTSGGEGLARYEHVKRLSKQLGNDA